MKSKIAQETERAMIETERQWTAEERLKAFVTHCQVVTELYQAGKDVRAAIQHDKA